MSVMTPAELAKMAASQAQTEISGQTAPLESQIPGLQSKETNAVGDIKSMFGSILPYSEAAAQNLQGAYTTAEGQQMAIFQAANQQMNDLANSRAQEAQSLAQQMGGPVAVGEFTSSMGYEPQALANLGAGQMLHTLGYGLADVGYANAFAGRVLPLVQTEQTAQAKQYYENQITDLQKQIATIKATKGTLTNSKLADLMTQERTFQLQKAQQALDKIKASHDWQATRRTLAQEDKRIKITQNQWKLQESQATGTYKGKQTIQSQQLAIEERKLTDAEKQQAAALGMSNKEFAFRKQQLAVQSKLASQKLGITQKATWAAYLDAAVTGQPGKSVSQSVPVPVPATAAQLGKVKGAYPDPNSPTGYSQLITQTSPIGQISPIRDPNQLVDFLVAHEVPKKTAVAMVQARLHMPNWSYGERDPRLPPQKSGPPAPGKSQPGPYGK
jgi:hypothetical protein